VLQAHGQRAVASLSFSRRRPDHPPRHRRSHSHGVGGAGREVQRSLQSAGVPVRLQACPAGPLSYRGRPRPKDSPAPRPRVRPSSAHRLFVFDHSRACSLSCPHPPPRLAGTPHRSGPRSGTAWGRFTAATRPAPREGRRGPEGRSTHGRARFGDNEHSRSESAGRQRAGSIHSVPTTRTHGQPPHAQTQRSPHPCATARHRSQPSDLARGI